MDNHTVNLFLAAKRLAAAAKEQKLEQRHVTDVIMAVNRFETELKSITTDLSEEI